MSIYWQPSSCLDNKAYCLEYPIVAITTLIISIIFISTLTLAFYKRSYSNIFIVSLTTTILITLIKYYLEEYFGESEHIF